jgi:hypothetical protein
MTRNEILNMEAGREMDALIAEKVMGISPQKVEGYPEFDDTREWVDIGDYVVYPEGVGVCKRLPDYSTNIAAAWLVVEHFCVGVFDIKLVTTVRGWKCEIYHDRTEVSANSEKAPLSICRAALLAHFLQ